MSKKHNAFKKSQYDDDDCVEVHYSKKIKKKETLEDDFLNEIDYQKQRANKRYLNKKRDKNKYKYEDKWN